MAGIDICKCTGTGYLLILVLQGFTGRRNLHIRSYQCLVFLVVIRGLHICDRDVGYRNSDNLWLIRFLEISLCFRSNYLRLMLNLVNKIVVPIGEKYFL